MTQDTQTAARARAGADTDTAPHRLIASNRVEGTAVYDRGGEKLGRIECFMVDKVSGQAAYAVMSFGGLFGLGGKHYPVPWDMLEYVPDKGGYVVDLDKEKLEKGPSFNAGEAPEFDRDYGRTVYDYYGIVYTW
ncbi:MAG TPA: PRC-barrel domain-containing protein [Allosphingosinicella sp.]|nr:PRC-barrel domain-containing protein [Allosphingosinicella sp.]